jgi:PAS domain S-box-containing protein
LNEILGRSVIEWTAEIDKEKNALAVKSCFEKGFIRDFEINYTDQKGNLTPIEINATCLSVAEKKQTITLCRDITDRKQAEDALKKLSLRQEALLTAIPDILMEVDANKVYSWANPAGYEFFGHDVIGREASYFFEGDQDTYSMVQPLFNGDESVIYLESWQRRKDGEKRLLAWWCRVLKDGSGRIVGALSTARDITEQKRAEEALRRNEKDLRESQRIAHIGSWRLDVATNEVVWTEELYNMYGFDPSLPPPPYTEHMKLFTPESWDRLSKALDRTRDTGIPYTLELETVRKDGSNGWMWVHGQADVDSTGKTVGLWGAAQDITERKRAEEENRLLQERLNRSEKMESLGMLAGGVAHDLNNVLGVVLGYSELLASSLDTSSPLQSQVEKIMKGTERAAEIVQDLLTLARRGVQTRSPVSINDVIMNFLKSPEYERILLCNPRMRVNADLQADILNMMGSKIHLHKTMMNLVSNASDAMPDGGCLNIKTSNQYLDRAISGYDHVREGDYVVLSVSDTGEGISSDDIRHIFEPFYTKKVMGRSGTGLGLAVVWGTVKDHEGYIDVQSEMGKGTTFDLYFPVTREKVSDEQIPVSLSDYVGKGESVLVVDDVKGQRDLASEMLSRLNYKVASVPSGEAAVEYLKANKADILVLDMIMDPGMDGLDTYKEILELYPGQKAVIVSGFSETDRIKKAHRLGAGAYVRKPYSMERLGLAVRRELDKK